VKTTQQLHIEYVFQLKHHKDTKHYHQISKRIVLYIPLQQTTKPKIKTKNPTYKKSKRNQGEIRGIKLKQVSQCKAIQLMNISLHSVQNALRLIQAAVRHPVKRKKKKNMGERSIF
jgi:hypothetical protein